MQLKFIGWRLILGSVRKKADDKHVTNALNEIQKILDEIIRRMDRGEVRFIKKD